MNNMKIQSILKIFTCLLFWATNHYSFLTTEHTILTHLQFFGWTVSVKCETLLIHVILTEQRTCKTKQSYILKYFIKFNCILNTQSQSITVTGICIYANFIIYCSFKNNLDYFAFLVLYLVWKYFLLSLPISHRIG